MLNIILHKIEVNYNRRHTVRQTYCNISSDGKKTVYYTILRSNVAYYLNRLKRIPGETIKCIKHAK